ncbi:FadR family transcriptional regulator [Rhodococcus sp. WS3]|uniref:FadR/GntR family transcriptional regulator n=1 Tax=Rhodococcus sp. WS3 TaxID=2486271 RepID=UPI0011412C97|nr:FCD domain-containing protein [Rhodococcus sp. WS3]ROZ49035.1 FadR family transcriptional regulator [Rhodococcus sp. WS3]
MPRSPQRLPSGDGRKLAEQVALEIEADTIDAGWPVGEVLGSETELIERYGVSRAVFREAVRIVEHHMVARMRRGPGGGLVVTAPDLNAAQRSVALYLDYANVHADDMFEARTAIETTAVRVATERLTEEGVVRLREMLAAEIRPDAEVLESGQAHDLHVTIAALTGNPALHLFSQILISLTFQRTGTRPRQYDAKAAAHEAHCAHEAIVEAMVQGDTDLAVYRMRRHLQAVATFFPERD